PLRAAVVEVRRCQRAGDQGPVRDLGDALLPGAQRPHRQARGARAGPAAREAAAAASFEPTEGPRRTPARHGVTATRTLARPPAADEMTTDPWSFRFSQANSPGKTGIAWGGRP